MRMRTPTRDFCVLLTLGWVAACATDEAERGSTPPDIGPIETDIGRADAQADRGLDEDAASRPDAEPTPDAQILHDAEVPPAPDVDPPDAAPPAYLRLVLRFDTPEAVAGEPVAYRARLIDALGDETPVQVSLRSNLEETLRFDAQTVTFARAGEHTVTAHGEAAGQAWTAEAPMTTRPGPPTEFRLTLSEVAVVAGTQVEFAVEAHDDLDNPVAVDPVEVELTLPDEIDSGALIREGRSIACVQAGSIEIMARWRNLFATATLQVRPGPPAQMGLGLQTGRAAAGTPVPYTVDVVDAFANPITVDPADLRVTAEPPGLDFEGQTVLGTAVGTYAIRVQLDDLDARAELQIVPGRPAILAIRLERLHAIAGVPLPYFVDLHDAFDNPIDVATVGFEATSEPSGLTVTRATLTGTAAGDYVVRVRTAGIEASTQVTVAPGPIASIDLVMDAAPLPAGERRPFAVEAQDAYGNEVDIDRSLIVARSEPPGLETDDRGVRGTAQGTYTLIVTYSDHEARRLVRLTAGDVAEIRVTPLPPVAEIDDFVALDARLVDAWGNDLPGAVVVRAHDEHGQPAAHVLIEGTTVRFLTDGRYELVLTTAGPGPDPITARVGPIIIDHEGPLITIDAPDHGAWTDEGRVQVIGSVQDATSGARSVTVNEQAAALADDGAFTIEIGVEPGVAQLRFEAIDQRGNATSLTRTVLAGDFGDAEQAVAAGVRLAMDSDAVNALGPFATGILDPSAIATALVGTPIFEDQMQLCTPWGCLPETAVRLDIDEVELGPPITLLRTTAEGTIEAEITAPINALSTRGALIEGGETIEEVTEQTDGSLTVRMVVEPRLVEQGPEGSPPSLETRVLSVEVTDPEWAPLGYSGPLLVALEALSELPIDALFFEAAEAAVLAQAASAFPGAFDRVLADLEPDAAVALFDNRFSFDANVSELDINEQGMLIAYDAQVIPEEWRPIPDAVIPPGPLAYAEPSPPAALDDGLTVDVSLDMVNAMLYALWGGGGFRYETPLSALEVDPVALGLAEPVEVYTVIAEPSLPPVVSAGVGNAPPRIDLSDYDLQVVAGDLDGPAEPQSLLGGHATYEGHTRFSVIDSNLAPDVDLDATHTQAAPAHQEPEIDLVATHLVAQIERDLQDSMTTFPLPASNLMPLEGDTAESVGENGRHLRMSNLMAEALE